MFRPFVISGPALCLALCLAQAAGARTRSHYGGALRIETQSDPWRIPDGIARKLVFDGLTRLDDSGVVLPGLAIRWDSQNDNHRWQFWLRPGVRFHDGAALTPASVAISLSQSCGKQCPWAGLSAVGNSLVFESDSALPELPAELARSLYLITRQRDAAEPSGTGPFRLTNLTNGVASLAENPDYWQGRPFVDTVQVEGKRSLRDQWLDLSVGRADIVEVPAELLHQALQDRLLVLVSRPTDLLVLSVSSKGALHDDQLRQAIALAVDRSALFNVIFQKEGEPTGSLLPAALTGYAFLFPTERDLTRARNYRAGLNTSPLVLAIENPDASMQLVAERIVLNLREAGLNAQVRPPSSQPPADLLLKRIHLEAGDSAAGLNEVLEDFSQKITEETGDPEALYKTERDFLKTYQAIPLLYLPRALAVGERVRDLRLAADGTPMIADVSINGEK
jgi:peptide/nickel transport system substrate-binding protein